MFQFLLATLILDEKSDLLNPNVASPICNTSIVAKTEMRWKPHSQFSLDLKTDDTKYVLRKYEKFYSSHNNISWEDHSRFPNKSKHHLR